MTLISNKTLCYRNPYAPIPGDVYAQGPDPQTPRPRPRPRHPEVADDDSPPSEDPAVVSDTADVDVYPEVSAPDILQDLIIDLLLVNNVFDEANQHLSSSPPVEWGNEDQY